MEAFGYTRDDLLQSIADTARMMSIPKRDPRWVKPTFWDWPLNETRTRPVPANSGWLDYITIQLGKQPGFAPSGYSLRLQGFVGTTLTDPLTNGVLYRFLKNGVPLPAQEFNITNNIEKGILRYSGVSAPWPAFARKIFLTVQNFGRLVLQVNNPSGSEQVCPAALYGYYFPNLGDLPKGSLEKGRDESETFRGD